MRPAPIFIREQSMAYTIKEVSNKVNLSAYTLRYYEKEGLLPYVRRNKHGNRLFGDEDLEWIGLICCLRDTGMPVAEIKRYVDLCMKGDETIQTRRQIIQNQKIFIEKQIEEMKVHLEKVNNKLKYYDSLMNTDGEACDPLQK
jgi:MerR family transcriptional regulator, aldehyde-responsive regulator